MLFLRHDETPDTVSVGSRSWCWGPGSRTRQSAPALRAGVPRRGRQVGQAGRLRARARQGRREERAGHAQGRRRRRSAIRSSRRRRTSKLVFRKRAFKPGSAIGYHVQHEDEIYYVLSGRGMMTIDGKEFEVGPRRRGAHAPGQLARSEAGRQRRPRHSDQLRTSPQIGITKTTKKDITQDHEGIQGHEETNLVTS